jgi:hypothetical protein
MLPRYFRITYYPRVDSTTFLENLIQFQNIDVQLQNIFLEMVVLRSRINSVFKVKPTLF